jgi:hypothetical protein
MLWRLQAAEFCILEGSCEVPTLSPHGDTEAQAIGKGYSTAKILPLTHMQNHPIALTSYCSGVDLRLPAEGQLIYERNLLIGEPSPSWGSVNFTVSCF